MLNRRQKLDALFIAMRHPKRHRRPVRRSLRRLAFRAALPVAFAAPAFAADHISLANGYDLVCDHRIVDGDRTRLYMDATSTDFIEVRTAAIASDTLVPDPPPSPTPATVVAAAPTGSVSRSDIPQVLTSGELHEVLQGAGQAHDLDVDLLASVVHAESAGRVRAQSHAGAQGLMQLMPATAASLGVHDAFVPAENVGGGAAYLDGLLTRYHDNLALALAAYNAGPGAVDRWHGVPPYRETRAYVARIIREFNSRYLARQASGAAALRASVKP